MATDLVVVGAGIVGLAHALAAVRRGLRVAVAERWMGVYPVADARPVLLAAPAPRVRVVDVTNGVGMSTAFALGEETVGELFA